MWEVLHAVLALVLVLGLLLLTVWVIKFLQVKAAGCGMLQKMVAKDRVRIVEQKRIDAKTKLVLFTKDDCEFLVLIALIYLMICWQKFLLILFVLVIFMIKVFRFFLQQMKIIFSKPLFMR